MGTSTIVNFGQTDFYTPANLAELRHIPSSLLSEGDNATVDGDVSVGDGGGGVYVYDADNLLAANGRLVIIPDDRGPTDPGRWIKINTGAQSLTLNGDVTGNISLDGTAATGTTTLATVNATPGTVGSINAIPVLTVDAKGRITAVSSASTADVAFKSATNKFTGANSFDNPLTFNGTVAGVGTGAVGGWYNDTVNLSIRLLTGANPTLYFQNYAGTGNSLADLNSSRFKFDVNVQATAGATINSLTLGTALPIASGGTGRTTQYPMLIASRAANISIGANFTTIPMTTVVLDSASGYNTTTGIYTVPEAGTYLITMKVRLADNVPVNVGYGVGVNTTMVDNAAFYWTTTYGVRNMAFNSRMYQAAAGDQLRLYVYLDSTTAQNFTAAELNIVRIR